jgi:hypothetical protein
MLLCDDPRPAKEIYSTKLQLKWAISDSRVSEMTGFRKYAFVLPQINNI